MQGFDLPVLQKRAEGVGFFGLIIFPEALKVIGAVYRN